MPSLDIRVLSRVVREWEAAPHGRKGAVLAQRLPLLGISLGTFHRQRLQFFGGEGRKAPETKGQRKRPEYIEAVQEIMAVKHSPIKGVRSLTTADAQVEAALNGCPLAAAIPEGTVNRIARELGLHPQVQRRENRFEASRPNELHQLDASRSEYFQCHQMRGGEWIIKLAPVIFRNRDYRQHRMRVWIWGLVDDCSGFRVLRYCVAKGENALDGIDFLQWAWSKSEAHAPFRGLPDILYLDQGPLNKTKAFQHFCREVAGVELKAHEAGRPQATGKVEVGWKALWRKFEARFFREAGWEGREFSLGELNQELAWWLKEENQLRHRRLPMSREAAWLAVQGVVDIEADAWRHIFHREARTLDAAGCCDFRGQVYQVQGLPYPGDVRVQVYLGVRDGAVLVVDPRDGRKYPAAPFELPAAGEYHQGERTPLEKLLKEPRPATGRRVTFQPGADGKVVHLVRRGELRASGFEMPAQAGKPVPPASLEELAAGVEVVERDTGRNAGAAQDEEIYASEVDWYAAMRVRELRGEALGGETLARMGRIREESRAYRLLRDGIEKRASLAAVE